MLKRRVKSFFIKTYGCQANISDSEKLARELVNLGFQEQTSLDGADIFIINSCSVRQKSEDKVYGWGRPLSKLDSRGQKPFVVLAGCIVGSTTGDRVRMNFSKLEKKTPWVDKYVSPEELFDIPAMLRKIGLVGNSAAGLKTDQVSNDEDNSPVSEEAYINISYGCDNFCTYCVVPYARGEERSRSRSDVITDIKKALEKGAKKIVLCGQNVNSWGLDKKGKFKLRTGGAVPQEMGGKLPFTRLLEEVNTLDGLEEMEFISSNPFDFTQDLIQALKLEKISNYIHIAVQSGNNDILRKMNRRHTVEEYMDLINKIKKVRPDMRFGTDVIVGFPGETRDQFMDTVELFMKVKFSVAFISMYSPREGTAAEKVLKDDIPLKEKKWRHEYLFNVWKELK